MLLKGQIIAESPIYRGNSRKTLFTRDGDGKHRLVSLAGEITGTAQSLMDAFIGKSKNGKNIGLIDAAWKRLYGDEMPAGLIKKVDCKLKKEFYPRNNFFDLRMGIRLDEDRWAAESNANYKMETVLRNAVFDMNIDINDAVLGKGDTRDRLFYVLNEIKEGRFWFGAGKSKGLGRLKLEMKIPFSSSAPPDKIQKGVNHLTVNMALSSQNPVLVGWNWGKIDPQTTSFASIDASLLLDAMKGIPEKIRKRLDLAIGGPILNPEDWKSKLNQYLPKTIAVWLSEKSGGEVESFVLSSSSFEKLGKGKHAVSAKILEKVKPFVDQTFKSVEEAEEEFKKRLGKKANMAKRIVKEMEKKVEASLDIDKDAYDKLTSELGLDVDKEDLEQAIEDETRLESLLSTACQKITPNLYEQVDQQIKLIQSDAWVDAEIKNRQEHLLIKKMLRDGKISEYQWNDPQMTPEGVSTGVWREFLEAHSKVRFRHMLNSQNLQKSIVNDENQIEFLKTYRDRTRQELARTENIDFRAGGVQNSEISRKYGKPYDTVFMRMLTWRKSSDQKDGWEAYIPGGTLKGAFRKRASQVLKTLWGESRKTQEILTSLFGEQGRQGKILFSDAYLVDPDNMDKKWCSMDGIRVNPKTGEPIESTKRDYLYAYGDDIKFQLRMDIQDIRPSDMDAVTVFKHLVNDFRSGDIPIGGEKTSGFGWVESQLKSIEWLTTDVSDLSRSVVGDCKMTAEGVWNRYEAVGAEAESVFAAVAPIKAEQEIKGPPNAREGFISHRMFGGYCGMLHVGLDPMTPLTVKESGEPMIETTFEGHPVNGWDFYSMSPPDAENRSPDRKYAVPGRSLKGMLRHIYSIATNTSGESPNLNRLNPADSLFGWVGNGPNQAIMGRLSFTFAGFESPELKWYKAPYPYGQWTYENGNWTSKDKGPAKKTVIADSWRVFTHAPLAPIVEQVPEFKPDTYQASYFRAVTPGASARFSIRFWNLTEEEMQRLVWCVALESGLAHKIGNHRHLGFGSVKLSILPESYLIQWNNRYSSQSKDEWREKLNPADFMNPSVVKNYEQLKTALNADAV